MIDDYHLQPSETGIPQFHQPTEYHPFIIVCSQLGGADKYEQGLDDPLSPGFDSGCPYLLPHSRS